MRVLDLNTLWIDGGEGGVNTYLREKARWLAEPGVRRGRPVRHTMVVPGARDEVLRIGATRVHVLKSPRFLGNPQHRILVSRKRIASILQEEAPDVVEVDASYLLGRIAHQTLHGAQRPAIVGFYHVDLPRLYTRPGRSWLGASVSRRTEGLAWKYARLCGRHCDRLLVATRDLHQRLSGRGLPPLELVPLGVNLEIFQPYRAEEPPVVPGIDLKRPIILYVGRLAREKELEVLIEAHRLVAARLGAQLVLAGDGPLRRRVASAARSSRGGIVYAGMCPYGEQLAALYRAASLLAVPGRNETFSLIVLEALASGVPVVATDEGGPSELLANGLGALARAGDAVDFAEKMLETLSRGHDPDALRLHAERNYSWERTFLRLLEVYEHALADRRPLVAAGGRAPAFPKPLPIEQA